MSLRPRAGRGWERSTSWGTARLFASPPLPLRASTPAPGSGTRSDHRATGSRNRAPRRGTPSRGSVPAWHLADVREVRRPSAPSPPAASVHAAGETGDEVAVEEKRDDHDRQDRDLGEDRELAPADLL